MRNVCLAATLLAFLIVPLAPRARGGDAPAEPEAIAAVRTALEGYDEAIKSGGADTVAVEKAVLDAGRSPDYARLVEFLAHERFGPLVLHVVCARGGAAVEGKALAAYLAWPAARRVEGARDIAALKSDGVRAALKALAGDPAISANEAMTLLVRAARLRAGDPESLGALEKALGAKEVETVAQGLLLAGDARATALLSRVGRFLDDKRPLSKAVPSQWPDTKTETSPDGTVTSSTVPVELGTIGDVALEAANRACASTLPEWVAWWYEPEKGPRFGRGADGAKLLKALLAEDAKAEKAKAMRALEAIEAVLRTMRGAESAGSGWKFAGASFEKTWTISGSIDGQSSAYGVAADGTVRKR